MIEEFDTEIKEDSPEKLAMAAGKPTKYFLFASEWNKIKIKFNQIISFINGNFTLQKITEIGNTTNKGIKFKYDDLTYIIINGADITIYQDVGGVTQTMHTLSSWGLTMQFPEFFWGSTITDFAVTPYGVSMKGADGILTILPNDILINGKSVALKDDIEQLKDGVSSPGDTLQKLYNLILGASSEAYVSNISARDAYDIPHLPFSIFVIDDSDGRWAKYQATSTGMNASFVKISDPDLLHSIMSNSQIKTAYESNYDTNAFTNALKAKLDGIDLSQYLLLSNISNNLTGTSTNKALSEAQGKYLKDLFDGLSSSVSSNSSSITALWNFVFGASNNNGTIDKLQELMALFSTMPESSSDMISILNARVLKADVRLDYTINEPGYVLDARAGTYLKYLIDNLYTAAALKAILGVSTFSGSNTGDETAESINSKLKRFVYKNSYFTDIVTGTTAETMLLQLPIPAGSFSENDIMNIPSLFFLKSLTNGTFTLKLKVSVSPTMPTGNTGQIAVYNGASTTLSARFQRTYMLQGGYLRGYSFTTSALSDAIISVNQPSIIAFDTGVLNYLYISATLNSASDSFKIDALEVNNT